MLCRMKRNNAVRIILKEAHQRWVFCFGAPTTVLEGTCIARYFDWHIRQVPCTICIYMYMQGMHACIGLNPSPSWLCRPGPHPLWLPGSLCPGLHTVTCTCTISIYALCAFNVLFEFIHSTSNCNVSVAWECISTLHSYVSTANNALTLSPIVALLYLLEAQLKLMGQVQSVIS